MAAAALLTGGLGLVLGDRRRAALIVSPAVVGLLMYGHVASYLSDIGMGPLLQQVGWVLLVVVATIGAVRLDATRIGAIDRVLTRVAAALVAVTLVLIVAFQATTVAGRGGDVVVDVQTPTGIAAKRDVYWVIFDRYGSDRSLELMYGVRNDITPWLREQGFTVLEDSYANYVRTPLSLVTTMNMGHLEDIEGIPGRGSSDMAPVYDALQSSLMARQMKVLGYRYYHIGSWWNPTRQDEAADVNLYPVGPSDFVNALVEESAIPPLLKRIGLSVGVVDADRRHYESNIYGLDALAGLRDEPGPKFVLAHIMLPHPPNVFDSDGSFVSGADKVGRPVEERFARQLAYANTRLREIIGGLVALPEAERPVIILQADEGPLPPKYRVGSTHGWSEATDEEIEAKFGILNAWYLPDGEDLGLRPSMTSINTFPTLFSRYFGLDYDPLPDRVFTSERYSRPYDLTDVTDRLPGLQ